MERESGGGLRDDRSRRCTGRAGLVRGRRAESSRRPSRCVWSI